MIQIIKDGNPDKKYHEKKILFDNKTTCPLCDCEFQFDSEDLIFPTYRVECPWCKTNIGLKITTLEDF